MSRPTQVESVIRACQILHAFHSPQELLRLRDLVERTRLSKTTTHRLLHSLESGGMVEHVGAEHYRLRIQSVQQRSLRIGFAAQTANSTFSRIVGQSIRRAAERSGMALIELDNRYSAKTALRNADMLIRERVDVVLEFQTYENVAPVIASRFVQAGIPVIAIEIPHPGAVFFGADNYQAGLIGGRALGKWVKQHWQGRVEEVLLLEEGVAGPLPRSRVTGMLAGAREVLSSISEDKLVAIDTKGAFKPTLEMVRQHLRRQLPQRTLVIASNDPTALGAIRAFEECSRSTHAAVISQNGIPEAREELRRPDSRLIGTVAYFPERYGDRLIALAGSLARGETVAPAHFVKHQLLTPQNVDTIYPEDKQQSQPKAMAETAGV